MSMSTQRLLPGALATTVGVSLLSSLLFLGGCGPQPTYQIVESPPPARVGTVESVREVVEQKQPSGAGLIVGYGLLVQGYGIWKLRHALSWRRVMPFIIGGAVGVPIGAVLLVYINPSHMRTVVGLLLVLYSAYGLARPVIKPVQAKIPADIGIGFLNGLLGGLTGLAGIVVVIWCQLRGWPKDNQRTISQPVTFAVFVMSAISLSIAGNLTAETVKLYLFGLPLVLAGTWTGLKLYGHSTTRVFGGSSCCCCWRPASR